MPSFLMLASNYYLDSVRWSFTLRKMSTLKHFFLRGRCPEERASENKLSEEQTFWGANFLRVESSIWGCLNWTGCPKIAESFSPTFFSEGGRDGVLGPCLTGVAKGGAHVFFCHSQHVSHPELDTPLYHFVSLLVTFWALARPRGKGLWQRRGTRSTHKFGQTAAIRRSAELVVSHNCWWRWWESDTRRSCNRIQGCSFPPPYFIFFYLT